MAKLGIDFSQVPPDQGRGDPLPADWYPVAIEKSEEKPTKDGMGSYLECTFGVIDGQFKGRKVFHRFNLRNNNAQAQEIAYKQMSAVAHAVGVLNPQDSSELHGRPLKIRVKVKPAEGEYEASNEITAFKNINEQTQARAAAPAQPGFAAPPMQQPGQPPQGWGPQGNQQPPAQQYAPQQPPQQPPAQQYAPQQYAPQQQPMQPPAQQPQQYAPQQQPQGGPPAWQPPAGAVQQPWQQPQQQPQPQQPPMQPAAMPPAFQPPPANVPQQGGAVTPPWMTPPQG